MKPIITCCLFVIAIMALSFQKAQKVKMLTNGNYSVTKMTPIKMADAKTLSELTRKAADETTAVNTKVYKDAVDQTVYKTKSSAALNAKQIATIRTIMAKYSR